MRFCENCGHQLDDMAAFCDNCGARVEREGEMSGGHHKETTGKKKTKVGIIVGAVIFGIVVLAVVGGLVIYPQVTQYMQEKEDQEKADYVVERINSVTSGEITLDSEKDLDSAKTEYNSLTDEQKSLVDNYDKLEEAYATLDGLKIEQENQEKAQSVIDAIEAIDSASLTDSDTSVQAIREQYDSLTDDQKKLVTNADKLTEYENIVQQKKEQKAEEEAQAQAEADSKNEINELVNHLTVYEGLWGDFGAHVNKYQGMIESTIKSSISLSGYFGGDVNEVYMYLYFQGDAVDWTYFIRFEGVSPSGVGQYRTLECAIVPNDSGTQLQFVEGSYY